MNQVIPYAADRARAVAPIPSVTDATGTVRAHTATATVDDYSTCYLSVDQGNNRINVVVKTPPPAGTTKTVNVTFAGQDVNSNALPPVTVAFDVQGPPPPPLATQINVASNWTATSGPLYAPGADGGSPTINLP